MINIFDIENGKLIVNEAILTIPELKEVFEYYSDPVPPLMYLWGKYDPLSPYSNLTSNEKEEVLVEDFPGEYNTLDGVLIKAGFKLEKLFETPTSKLLKRARIGLEKLGDYLENAEITEGRDGNFAAFGMNLTRIGKMAEDFKKLEKIVDSENKDLRTRGDKQQGFC